MSKQRRQVEEYPVSPLRERDDGSIEADVLTVEVFYALGGMNYFNGHDEPRGYYVSVSVAAHGKRPGSGFGYVSFGLFAGTRRKHFLEPATRFNAKRLAAIVPPADVVAAMKEQVMAALAEELAKR